MKLAKIYVDKPTHCSHYDQYRAWNRGWVILTQCNYPYTEYNVPKDIRKLQCLWNEGECPLEEVSE